MPTKKTGVLIGAACAAACAAPAVVLWVVAGATAGGLWIALKGELGLALAALMAGGVLWWVLRQRRAAKLCCEGGVSCSLSETTR